MKLWLASYPRSGNTFTRMILNQCFGIRSTSVYEQENASMPEVPWLAERIGYAGDAGLAGTEWIALKTHGYPSDDAPAIYVVRDGRAATVSYAHWLKTEGGRSATFDELIRGEIWPGSWTDHFKAWDPENRPATLLLRYEDLILDRPGVIQKIEDFLKTKANNPFTITFDELNKLSPTLFRSGHNKKNIDEFRHSERLFYEHHRQLMQHLGYLNHSFFDHIHVVMRRAYKAAASIIGLGGPI